MAGRKKKYSPADALADAGEKVRRSTAERDQLIADIAETGELSQRAIATAVGLSHTAIAVIARRAAES